MAIAAVPAYLGQDFTTASPGLRFGMYLPLWGVERRSGELLWSTHDVKYEVRGQEHQERSVKHENKVEAIRRTLGLTPGDIALLQALRSRQSALAEPVVERGGLLAVHARAVAPFTTGLGNEHPLENGYAFLSPYGLPYLPGSGVKGVLRQAAHELASGDWGERHGWDDAAIDALFGTAPPHGSEEGHQRGALSCWDVFVQLAGDALQVEVMTPHQSHYQLQGKTPHDSGSPNPISFLAVPPGSGFVFHLQCDVPFLKKLRPSLVLENRWQSLLQAALAHAFAWLGFGAKTAVGYGAMTVDAEQARRALQAREDRDRLRAELQRLAEREAAKAQMSPAEQAMADLFDARADKNQDERAVLFSALKAGRLGEHRVAAAERLRTLMQQQGRWRDSSQKKNPDKDQPYQDTLLVRRWLQS